MKKIFFATMLITAFSYQSNAQSEKFTSAMKSSISLIDSSFKNPSDLLSLVNTFERIGSAEKNQWLPYYYAAFCQVNFAFMAEDKSKMDELADKATKLIDKADSLQPGNSEVSCIKSMIASAHLMVNPMQRYMEYGPVSEKHLENAIAQDSTNPRPYFLKGQSLRYTPEQFGGGCKTAMVEFEKAMARYLVFNPSSEIAPNWGRTRTEMLIAECR
jgi:hypothetical protein